MNPSDPYWIEAAQYIQSTTGQRHLRTGMCLVTVFLFVAKNIPSFHCVKLLLD